MRENWTLKIMKDAMFLNLLIYVVGVCKWVLEWASVHILRGGLEGGASGH